jgi:hypothetical protein
LNYWGHFRHLIYRVRYYAFFSELLLSSLSLFDFLSSSFLLFLLSSLFLPLQWLSLQSCCSTLMAS